MNNYGVIEFENMNKGQMINFVLKQHYNSIVIAAKKVKGKYKWIPLEFDDLFNVFINKIPSLIKKFDCTMNTKLSTYIINNAFYSMANYARRYSAFKFRTLNERVIVEGHKLEKMKKYDFAYQTITTLAFNRYRLDITGFTSIERKILREYFLEKKSIDKVAIIHKFSYNKTSRLIKQIKHKVKTNNRNLTY